MKILQKIFNDHFDTIANSGISICDTVFENVNKMLHCGDYNYGYALFGCEHCGNTKIVPFLCKICFCTSCGNLYSFKRSTHMSFKLINTSHRHCVFNIPEELRPFFVKIELSWIVFLELSLIVFSLCFLKWINLKTLLPASSAFFILSAEVYNGTLIFMSYSLKVPLATVPFGAELFTSTTLSSEILFVCFF